MDNLTRLLIDQTTKEVNELDATLKVEYRKKKVTKAIVRDSPKIGRNELCFCGSGKKYKKCCL